eukprot:364245-Chlamydomonas_euryale.AAC.7
MSPNGRPVSTTLKAQVWMCDACVTRVCGGAAGVLASQEGNPANDWDVQSNAHGTSHLNHTPHPTAPPHTPHHPTPHTLYTAPPTPPHHRQLTDGLDDTDGRVDGASAPRLP